MRFADGLPTVAIVGRPNVGKSTLFNRILRRRLAVVHDEAGITRDRNYALAEWNGRRFWLVDTGGVILWDGRGLEPAIQQQVESAIEEADLIVLLLDGNVGLAPEDEEVTRTLLRKDKPALVVANKADDPAREAAAAAIVAGGLGPALPVAALSGRGIGDLLDRVVEGLPPGRERSETPPENAVGVAIVGRPNVGKSSLVNAILGEKKMIVSEVAGTTRDSVDTPVEIEGECYLLIDTAGLRRRSRVREGVEYWSVLRAIRALERCDVAVVVLDATATLSEQDVKIAAEATDRYKGVVLVANKWDAVEKDHDTALEFEDRLKWHFKFLSDSPLIYASALTGRRVGRILPAAGSLARMRRRRIATARVNEVLRRIVERHPPPSNRSSRATRILYGTQVSVRPPTFAVFTNRPENLEGHYTRFLRNRLKEEFRFEGVPVKVVIRKREGKDAG
jgi:GTP-binding protein